MNNLRNKVIRLAHEKPELRAHLLPLLKTAGVKTARGTYKDYLKRHKSNGSKSPALSQGAWNALHRHHGDKPHTREHHAKTKKSLSKAIGASFQRFQEAKAAKDQDGMSSAFQENKDAHKAYMASKHIHDGGADHDALKHSPKKMHPHQAEMMEKHSLIDDDIDEMKKLKSKTNPGQLGDKSRLSDRERLNIFLAHCSAETKARMQAPPPMTPADFVKLLSVLTDDEEGAEGQVKAARSGAGFMFEKGDFGMTWRRTYQNTVTLYWPLENIGKRGRRVQQREVTFRCDESNTAWADWWADQLQKASNAAAANTLLTKLYTKAIKECDDNGWKHWEGDYTETLKGVDKGIPTPKSRMVKDIKGSDVSVSMNGREIVFSSKSDDKKWMEQGYQVYDLTAPKREQKKVDSVRDLLEKAKGYDQVEKILQSAKVRFKTNIRMDSMYL